MKVLIGIDILNDFCPGGSLAVTEGDRVVEPTNRLAEFGNFDLKILVQESHPPGHISFASSHPGKQPFTRDEKSQMLWPDHGVQDTPGGEFHPALKVKLFDHIFKKGTNREVDSYSAFFDNAGVPTGLEELIMEHARKRGKTLEQVEVTLTGLALDYCVGWSARHCAKLGFHTNVVFDATRSITPDGEREILRELRELGVQVLECRELLPNQARNVNVQHAAIHELKP